MTRPDWGRLSAQVDRTYRKDQTRGTVRLRGDTVYTPQNAPKNLQGVQSPLVENRASQGGVHGVSGQSTEASAVLLEQWRAVRERLINADRWFAEHERAADPRRYDANEDRYCTLMGQSIDLAKALQALGVSCKDAA